MGTRRKNLSCTTNRFLKKAESIVSGSTQPLQKQLSYCPLVSASDKHESKLTFINMSHVMTHNILFHTLGHFTAQLCKVQVASVHFQRCLQYSYVLLW